MNFKQLLKDELHASFRFLHERANTDPNSKGYGLIQDNNHNNHASIASVGFYLAAIPAVVEANFYTKEELHARVKGTLETFLYNVDHHEGMYAHFIDIESGKRVNECEFSTIDTTIFLMGAMTIQNYFDEVIYHLVDQLIHKANFNAYIITSKYNSKAISMAYGEKNPIYDNGNGFSIGSWSMMAEHMMLYFLLAAHPNFDSKLALEMYESMHRQIGSYKSDPFIFEVGGPLFIHQYGHAFIDFSKIVDCHNYDWFMNSVNASIANHAYCIDQTLSKTFSSTLWGLTACLSPSGYVVNGALPNGTLDGIAHHDGTFSVCGPLGSLPFVPHLVEATIFDIEKNYPELKGEYGYYDGLNLDVDQSKQVVKDYIGINKGISAVMIGNYLYNATHKQIMEHPAIKKAIKQLQFKYR